MLFNTLQYAKFFAVVFTLAWLLRPWQKARLAVLMVASYVFYAGWPVTWPVGFFSNPSLDKAAAWVVSWIGYLPLLFFCSTLDFVLGRLVEKAESQKAKKGLLMLTLVSNLGILAVFKYWNFGLETATWVAARFGLPFPDISLRLSLPIGISFFTFMSLSYVVDVYRGTIPACRNYLNYLTFIAFFPHLVAGPIVRGRDLLPALERPVKLTPDLAGEGLFLIACGLVKKVIIGDYLAVNLVDRVFTSPSSYSALESLAGIYGYAVQVYCDFSGYSDIAIGSALLIGYRFPLNFDSPFKATNVANFWRRWHISLSNWLRDYVYIPLGGSRKGRGRKYLNVFLTMVICGIWHGAAWTFVVFGIIQGTAVAITHFYRDSLGKKGDHDVGAAPWKTVLAVFTTFTFTAFSFMFIRAESVAKVVAVLARLPTMTTYHPNLRPGVLLIMLAGLMAQWAPDFVYTQARQLFSRVPAVAQALILFGLAFALREAASAEVVPFVYFQF